MHQGDFCHGHWVTSSLAVRSHGHGQFGRSQIVTLVAALSTVHTGVTTPWMITCNVNQNGVGRNIGVINSWMGYHAALLTWLLTVESLHFRCTTSPSVYFRELTRMSSSTQNTHLSHLHIEELTGPSELDQLVFFSPWNKHACPPLAPIHHAPGFPQSVTRNKCYTTNYAENS